MIRILHSTMIMMLPLEVCWVRAHHCLEVLHLWDAEGSAILLSHRVIVLQEHHQTVLQKAIDEVSMMDRIALNTAVSSVKVEQLADCKKVRIVVYQAGGDVAPYSQKQCTSSHLPAVPASNMVRQLRNIAFAVLHLRRWLTR